MPARGTAPRPRSGASRAASSSRASASGGASRPRGGAKVAIPQLAWHEARPAPIVLVSGPEDFLADRVQRGLRQVARAADPALEVSDLDAADYAAGDLATLASPSLFGEARLIRVASVDRCTDAFLDDALRYLDSPADDVVLVLRHRGGQRGKRLLDAVRGGAGGGVEVVCAELKRETDRVEFVRAEFRSADRRVTPGALRALTGAFSTDLADLAAACRQLIDDTAGTVTEETVDAYHGGRVETTAFRVADAAVAGQRGEALVALRRALAAGSDPVPMVAAFALKLRTMAKLAGARGPAAQLASRLGLAPWQAERAQRDLAGWDEESLAHALVVLADTDALVKGGSRDAVHAVERMVRLVAARGSEEGE